MRMPLNEAQAVVAEFIDSVLLPAAGGGLRAFSVGFVGALAVRQTPAMVEQYAALGKSLGLVDGDGMLDVDTAIEEARKALAKSGPMTIGGYTVDGNDLDRLAEIMRRHSR